MKRKTVDIFLVALFAFAAVNLLADYTFQRPETDQRAEIVEVVDGDTVDITRNGEEDTVRILGIDTPEVYSQNTPSEFFLKNTSKNRKCLKEMGEKASNFAKKKLSDQTVEVVQDSRSDDRGSYGRLLSYIEYNKTDLGEEILERGYARVYNSSFERKEVYRELETESREEGRGIWNESCGG
jgi:micrococcal nuclease